MESVKSREESFAAALDRLEEICDLFFASDSSNWLHEIYRDSLIKRFEFSFDLFWKVLKDYLMKQHGIIVASPRSVFREAFTQKAISQSELNACEDMLDDRNSTAHRYDGAEAEAVAERIKIYYDLMVKIFDTLSVK